MSRNEEPLWAKITEYVIGAVILYFVYKWVWSCCQPNWDKMTPREIEEWEEHIERDAPEYNY